MSRKKFVVKSECVLFNVLYEDGMQTSNRKVAADVVNGLDADAGIREVIEAQDREIEERSGRRLAPIKTVPRAA